MTTFWTKEAIQLKLATDDRFVAHALVELLSRQTAEEQRVETTKVNNDQGFTQADAKRMTSMAKQVLAWREHKKYPTPLSPKQLAWLRSGKSTRFPSRIGKYHRQLCDAANATLKALDEKIAHVEAELKRAEYCDDHARYLYLSRTLGEELRKLKEQRAKKSPPTILTELAA